MIDLLQRRRTMMVMASGEPVYEYELLEKGSEVNGYINYAASGIASDANAKTFIYDCSTYKYVKIVAADNKCIAPYARFVDSNNALIGSKISYTGKAETELEVPSGAVRFDVTDTYNSRSNQVTVYGKKG